MKTFSPASRDRPAARCERQALSRISARAGHERGTLRPARGRHDQQKPHHEDEIYYVIRGRARFKAGFEDREVSAGSVIFVAAEVGHRFYDITRRTGGAGLLRARGKLGFPTRTRTATGYFAGIQ